MTNTLSRFMEIKKQTEEASSEYSEAQGAFSHIQKRIKKEFGCSSFKEAEALLSEMEKEETALSASLNKAMTKFEKAWKDHLK